MELISVQPLTGKGLVNLIKEREYRTAVYEQTYIRRVLFEKYTPMVINEYDDFSLIEYSEGQNVWLNEEVNRAQELCWNTIGIPPELCNGKTA